MCLCFIRLRKPQEINFAGGLDDLLLKVNAKILVKKKALTVKLLFSDELSVHLMFHSPSLQRDVVTARCECTPGATGEVKRDEGKFAFKILS